MAKSPEGFDIYTLTPKNIPEYAERTGRSEEELLREYAKAKSENKALFGMIVTSPYWLDEVIADDGEG